MDDQQILHVVLREMQAIGSGWRNNWSEFDGRWLRDQLDAIAVWAWKAREDPSTPEYTAGTEFYKEQCE